MSIIQREGETSIDDDPYFAGDSTEELAEKLRELEHRLSEIPMNVGGLGVSTSLERPTTIFVQGGEASTDGAMTPMRPDEVLPQGADDFGRVIAMRAGSGSM